MEQTVIDLSLSSLGSHHLLHCCFRFSLHLFDELHGLGSLKQTHRIHLTIAF